VSGECPAGSCFLCHPRAAAIRAALLIGAASLLGGIVGWLL